MPNDPYNILVVCTGNICRSPMAEGMLKKNLPERLSGRVAISSAGTHALHGNMAQPHAIQVMQGYDIDIIKKVSEVLTIPVIACGGAGKLEDLAEATKKGGASAAAAGSLFVFHGKHRGVLINYPSQKELQKAFH